MTDSPFITVSRGGPEIPENFEPGAYIVVLTAVSDPKTVTAQRGPQAGQDIDLIDWTFEIFDGPFTGTPVEASTSTASGPKSKMFGYLTALFGKPPTVGQQLSKDDLISKLALATITVDDGGWLRITNLSAIPASMLAGKLAAATGAPMTAPGAPAPVAAPTETPVATATTAATAAPVPANPAGDLPF